MKMDSEKTRLITNIIFCGIGCVLIAGFAFFCLIISVKSQKNVNEERSTQGKEVNGDETYHDTSTGTDQSTHMNGEQLGLHREYYLLDENGKVSIYEVREGENVFYDYAAVEESLMPDNMRVQLKKGLYIPTEAQLYEFLQTYSS